VPNLDGFDLSGGYPVIEIASPDAQKLTGSLDCEKLAFNVVSGLN
jgi:hypothetical protein